MAQPVQEDSGGRCSVVELVGQRLIEDETVYDHGSIVTFKILTNYAKAWVDENVQSEPWQWRGAELFVDARPAKALLDSTGPVAAAKER